MMIRRIQHETEQWVVQTLGAEVLKNKRERLLRFAEEAFEFLIAAGLAPTDIHMIMDYVRKKEAGRPQEPAKEAGDTMFTLMSACNCLGIDLEDAVNMSMRSAWQRQDEIRTKQEEKRLAGVTD